MKKLFTILIWKCKKWVKILFCHDIFMLLRREIFLCSVILQGQCVMLLKWESFGDLLS